MAYYHDEQYSYYDESGEWDQDYDPSYEDQYYDGYWDDDSYNQGYYDDYYGNQGHNYDSQYQQHNGYMNNQGYDHSYDHYNNGSGGYHNGYHSPYNSPYSAGSGGYHNGQRAQHAGGGYYNGQSSQYPANGRQACCNSVYHESRSFSDPHDESIHAVHHDSITSHHEHTESIHHESSTIQHVFADPVRYASPAPFPAPPVFLPSTTSFRQSPPPLAARSQPLQPFPQAPVLQAPPPPLRSSTPAAYPSSPAPMLRTPPPLLSATPAAYPSPLQSSSRALDIARDQQLTLRPASSPAAPVKPQSPTLFHNLFWKSSGRPRGGTAPSTPVQRMGSRRTSPSPNLAPQSRILSPVSAGSSPRGGINGNMGTDIGFLAPSA